MDVEKKAPPEGTIYHYFPIHQEIIDYFPAAQDPAEANNRRGNMRRIGKLTEIPQGAFGNFRKLSG